MSRRVRLILLLVGAIWTAPNTLLGVLVGSLGLLRGSRCAVRDGALAFLDYPWGPRGALTLGQVILVRGTHLDARFCTYADRAAGKREGTVNTVRLGDHEFAHVCQYLLFGPLFLPLYLMCGGISARNPFERAADRYALGQGDWWPWGRMRTP
ncbi:MAG: hypothetical protein LKM32_15770 [Chiayiivirga sp.]|jgi:hypothetical protein|uniref:hypothetical protein n=1 Tax=Chiayiivirga sp. TaxID=2041042 RepID=UPI0025C30262|nr:hypothetical protein [Chiayiivirga sp.]MCI1730772.1 hypothetical protein [Chiayiivirga sp.]